MRRSVTALAVLGVALLVGLLVYGVAAKQTDRTLDDAAAKGERPPAPDRSLGLLKGGGEMSLVDLRGKIVVLNFWASWCDPCEREAPALKAVQRDLGNRGTVLGVVKDDSRPDALGFTKRFATTWPNVRDVDGELAREYAVRGLPETFIIDPKGRVTGVLRGEATEDELEREIAKAERP